jgi:hypothetical protein
MKRRRGIRRANRDLEPGVFESWLTWESANGWPSADAVLLFVPLLILRAARRLFFALLRLWR